MRALLLLGIVAAAPGHDLYLRPHKWIASPGESVRLEFHNGDAFPASEQTVILERLKDAASFWRGGESSCTGIRDESEKLTVAQCAAPPAGGHFLLAARTTPNFIELDAEKFEAYLRHERLEYVSEFRKNGAEATRPGRELYSKYVKSLLVAGEGDEFFRHRVGFPIEFVPVQDPYAQPRAASIKVLLLFRGRPAPGHEVELQVAAEGKVETIALGPTDSQGMVDVPLRAGGLHKLHAIIMERLAPGREADWESFWATLTFGAR